MLENVKMLIIVGILTFISMINITYENLRACKSGIVPILRATESPCSVELSMFYKLQTCVSSQLD